MAQLLPAGAEPPAAARAPRRLAETYLGLFAGALFERAFQFGSLFSWLVDLFSTFLVRSAGPAQRYAVRNECEPMSAAGILLLLGARGRAGPVLAFIPSVPLTALQTECPAQSAAAAVAVICISRHSVQGVFLKGARRPEDEAPRQIRIAARHQRD